MEIWKDVKGYEGRYEVSNYGRVKSKVFYSTKRGEYMNRKYPRMLKPTLTHDGYVRVGLSKECKNKSFTVHRLVAIAFIPNPDGLPEVNHKDECSTNNHVDNLEWCTGKYNSNYGTLPERIRIWQTNNPKRSKPVVQMTMDGVDIKRYPSTREAERQTGLRTECIIRCCKGRQSHSGGFKWRYDNGSM